MGTSNQRGDGHEPVREAVRNDVRAWLSTYWDPGRSLRAWRALLADSGWAAPSWPADWCGRGLPTWADGIAAEELARVGAVGTPLGAGMGLAAPTLLAHGDDTVKRALLRPILTGEHTWCQLFSEPGSGSDLAGLTTRAELDGDEWVVNGQKLWSTSAHHADFAILLARTDWDVPKHKGITYFVLPMHQPGVEPRPLRQMNFHASFNEVFISDARIPAAFVVGAPGEGWRAAMTTLAFERRLGAVRRPHVDRNGGRALREYEVEAEEYFATYRWYPQRAGRADLTVGIATANGTKGDPVVRQRLAGLFALQRSHQLNAQRAEAARAQGRSPAAYGSLGKLGLSAVARAAAAVHSTLAGATGMLAGTALAEAAFAVGSNTAATHPIVAEVLISVPAQSIAGGTDEIQHNIIGEQLLGLPRDPVVDRDLPFRQTRGSPAGRHGKPIAGHQG